MKCVLSTQINLKMQCNLNENNIFTKIFYMLILKFVWQNKEVGKEKNRQFKNYNNRIRLFFSTVYAYYKHIPI